MGLTLPVRPPALPFYVAAGRKKPTFSFMPRQARTSTTTTTTTTTTTVKPKGSTTATDASDTTSTASSDGAKKGNDYFRSLMNS